VRAAYRFSIPDLDPGSDLYPLVEDSAGDEHRRVSGPALE
jgi:hypothetical protein